MSRELLYLDCVGGVAGDMLLAALVAAGGDENMVNDLPRRLGVEDVSLEWSSGRPGGFTARRLEVIFDHTAHPHHRGLGEIEEILDRAEIPDGPREQARRVFRQLAEAEGQVHGKPPAEVHFHEVGAVDALIDIVGVCVALGSLDVGEIVCSPLPMGRGTVDCAHGTLPLPAPAVVAMLPGVPVYDAGIEGETVTPTGAALVTTLADRFAPMPAMTVEAVGVGAGSREYPGLPNIVRAFRGKTSAGMTTPSPTGTHIVECNVDDLDPRVIPVVIERLMETGALDAYCTPLVMKKGRPGHLLTAIVAEPNLEATVDVMLGETTSLGCRTYPVGKRHLERRMEEVQTPWGRVPVKAALVGGRVLRRVPEFEACAEIARKAGVPVRDVLAAAAGAHEDHGGKDDD